MEKPVMKRTHPTRALLFILMFTFLSQAVAEEFCADLVVVSANVITIDDGNPRAEAFAVKNGKFIAVGTNSQIKKLIGKDTNVTDVQGKTITPGFIDAHLHPRPVYPVNSRLGKVDLSPTSVKTMDELINALREKAKTTPQGQWVFGSRYQDTKLGRHPNRWDLDKASIKHPISISHSSGHVRVVNSLALKNAKITKDTPDPPGGGFDRDENGTPNGICREGAGGLARRGSPPPPSATREEKLKGYRLCFKSYLSKGITSIGDAGSSGSDMPFYQELIKRGIPMVRIYNMLGFRYLSQLKDLHLGRGFGNKWLRLGAIKFFHGNSLSGRTCWLYEPYDMINPKTGKKDYYGIPPGRSQEELDKLVYDIHKAGFQVACHSNGDREIDMVLDAIEKAQRKLPRNDHRHRIEHCSVVNPQILKRVKKLGVVLALHSYVYEHGDKMEDYGPKRWPMMHPNRSALEMSIVVAGNSDSPVSAADPLLRIQSMVTRKTAEGKVYGPEQKVSVENAIRIWTMGGAYASFEEEIKGSIEVGKLADFVILSQNPMQVSPDSIKDINVEKTYVNGKLAFGRRDDGFSVFEPVCQKSHTKKIRSGQLEYSINMDGTVDMDNTTTRLYETFKITFQNNISLTLANTGNTTVKNPRIITNGKRRWWCMEELLCEILAEAKNDQEKAFFIYDFVRSHRHHDDPIFTDNELHDPVKILNVFGAGLCDDSGYVGCSLFYHAGLNEKTYGKNPSERTLHGHMICEAILSNGYQFLDIDENTYYLDLENELPVSGDAIVRDHYLAKREHAYGPMFKGWRIGEKAASLFGRDDGSTFRAVSGHRIDFNLRPGERIIYRWDNCGKFASDDSQNKRNRRFWGTSLWIYEPLLTNKRIKADTKEASDKHLTYEMKTPYAVCGGRVNAEFLGRQQTDHFIVSVSLDGKKWKKIWEHRGSGKVNCNVDIDEALEYKKAPAKYVYFVKINSNRKAINSLRIESDIMTSPHTLPRLSLGQNKVEYIDETTEPHEVTITYLWRESNSVKPIKPPKKPITPGDGETVRTTTVPFKWLPSKDAKYYHIRVSRRKDMKLTYRPSFDMIITSSEHHSPFAGLFNPDEQYYWQVRVCNNQGVWGKWSSVWKFKWQGPRIPINLKHTIQEQKITISWKPNQLGTRPVIYEVYGSNERGFTPSKKKYEVMGLGTQTRNLLCTTSETKLLVVSPDATKLNMNCSFYRVVAVDENGVASGPSELLELPHPFIYSKLITTTGADKPYHYQVKTLKCIGDLQYRYAEPNMNFWEEEGYEFELIEKPAWLNIDKGTGLLTGTPSSSDKGTHNVTVVCHRKFPHELKPGDYRSSYFLKNGPRFQSRHQQTFELNVR